MRKGDLERHSCGRAPCHGVELGLEAPVFGIDRWIEQPSKQRQRPAGPAQETACREYPQIGIKEHERGCRAPYIMDQPRQHRIAASPDQRFDSLGIACAWTVSATFPARNLALAHAQSPGHDRLVDARPYTVTAQRHADVGAAFAHDWPPSVKH